MCAAGGVGCEVWRSRLSLTGAEAGTVGALTSRSLGGDERDRKRLNPKNFFFASFSLAVLCDSVRESGTIGADVWGSIEGAREEGVSRMSGGNA